MATPITILTAALHAKEPSARYSLAGIIISAWGHVPRPLPPTLEEIEWPLPVRLGFLLTDHSLFDPSILAQIEYPGHEFTLQEQMDGFGWFLPNQAEWCAQVQIPVLYALSERDLHWPAGSDNVQAFSRLFTPVGSAPYCIKWSYAGKGWQTRCFGWAMEAANDFDVKRANPA